MPQLLSELWISLPTLIFSTLLGIFLEKTCNITGRIITPLWGKTFGRAIRRRRSAHEQEILSPDTYAVGAGKHEIFVSQFALKGFDEKNLSTGLSHKESAATALGKLPVELRPLSADAVAEKIRLKAAELEAAERAWNARKFALRKVNVSRLGGVKEDPTLSLEFAETDYATFQVIANAWEQLVKRDGAGRQPLSAEQLHEVQPGLSNSFGVNLTVETANGDIILTKRSGRTQGARNLRHISVNEGMSLDDVDLKTGIPDPYLTAFRGLEEELGLDLKDNEDNRGKIKFHSLICDVTRYEWALLGHVRLTDTPYENGYFQGLRRLGVSPDDWESVSLEFLPLGLSAIEEAIEDDSGWVGHGYMNLVLSAMHRMPINRKAIFAAAKTALENSARTARASSAATGTGPE